MIYTYLAYGIPVVSTLELPALVSTTDTFDEEQILFVTEGKVPENLEKPPLESKPFSIYNETELLYTVPDVARFYVREGKEIIIERTNGDWSEVLLFFYANGMAAALFQRDLIPFHVSGVFMDEGKVVLFAAPSRTGKSTTAVMLQEKGYAPFTDDTAVLFVENGKCYAQASYPMTRLWQNSITNQTVWEEQEKQPIRTDIEIDKFGFLFHEQFVSDRVEVAGIVFLDAEGDEMKTEKLKPALAMQHLGTNIYRKQWLNGMKKHLIQFQLLTSITNTLPVWQAYRPKGEATFTRFAELIEDQIIRPLNEKERESH